MLAEVTQWLSELGLFVAKLGIVAIVVLMIVRALRTVRSSAELRKGARIAVYDLSDRMRDVRHTLRDVRDQTVPKTRKQRRQLRKKYSAEEQKETRSLANKPCAFVFDFQGDITASDADDLGRLVSAILLSAKEGDEVLCRLTSPGGTVDGYGLVASELERFREAGLNLTVAVDRVAASGGYMAACVANTLIAAPFAYIGSIGVILQLPNMNRFLKRWDVDYETIMAGDNKRSLTLFGENTDEGRALAQEQTNRVHGQFKALVAKYRPNVAVDDVGNGDHWSAEQAVDLGLVDRLCTSAEWLRDKFGHAQLIEVRLEYPQNPVRRVLEEGAQLMVRQILRLLGRA